MPVHGKATRIDLFSFSTPQMRAFHLAWFAFFSAFFAWFGIAPLMPVVREDLGLTQAQVGNTIIGSVTATIFVRLLIGPMCDRFGARRTYTALLILGAIPVMTIGLASSYEAFLLFRVAIGAIGAAFVVTQYHTSVMFASNCVGTANATTAGWGNLGGGVTQIAMPLMLTVLLAFGFSASASWRLAMVLPGVVLVLIGIAYYRLTQDSPEGNFRAPRGTGTSIGTAGRRVGSRRVLHVARDPRVWLLFALYGACFGVELTINNVAALYFHDRFELGLRAAGLVAGSFGLMNIFARTLGGYFSDRIATRWGPAGRVRLLFGLVAVEGLVMMTFSTMGVLHLAIATLLTFSLFVQMAEGATFGIVPFVNPRAMGTVAGIVGAGGNVGAVAAGFLFRIEGFGWDRAFLYLGSGILLLSLCALLLRFPDRPRLRVTTGGDAEESASPGERAARTPALAG